MRRLFIIISIIATTLSAQPKETVEFQLNTISGQVLNSLDHTPVNNLKVELLSGNNLLKGSSITDENGNFNMENVGYVYVFSNKSLPPNTYKIGSTYKLPEERAEQLSGTAHLTPFKVVYKIKIQPRRNDV